MYFFAVSRDGYKQSDEGPMELYPPQPRGCHVDAHDRLGVQVRCCNKPCALPFKNPIKPDSTICFFGDSLIGRTERTRSFSHVTDTLQKLHPRMHFKRVISGIGGSRIADLRAHMESACLAHRPDAAILYWDSDASDIPLVNDTKDPLPLPAR